MNTDDLPPRPEYSASYVEFVQLYRDYYRARMLALIDYAEHKGDCALVCVRVPEGLANRMLSGKTSVADDAEWERLKVAAACTCGLSKLLAACEVPK